MVKRWVLIATILSLISCAGCSGISKSIYVKPVIPALPEKPVYYDVEWGQGEYCVNERGAKNLLKNRELDKDYQKQLESIIEGLR